ncbi:MAG: serine/threonine protein kinase, partial [Chloroflexi bacterium]|nr:serine/threonine protein kinase [Chloroflexota bacterium]
MFSEALLAGRYQLQQLITADTLKELWSARDVRLDRDVTVELVTASSAELRARFTSRARLLAANNHPQLVSVY